MASTAHHSVPELKKFTVTNGMTRLIWSSCFIGVVTALLGFAMNAGRTWQAMLTSMFFFASISVGGLFLVSIQHVTKAGWSVTVRRVMESFTAFLPYAALMALIIGLVGGSSLFEWMQADKVAANELLQKKVAYLNKGFFGVRTVIFFGLWVLFSKLLVGHSLQQDKTGDEKHTLKSLPISIGFLLTFALSYSLFSVDFLMSLHAEWFSTIFGIYTFAGLFQSTLAMMLILLVWMMNRGLLQGFVNENHLHDLGKFLFAFTVFYAYIAFSQFMLIWYANLPEETTFFLHRAHGGWFWVSMSLLLFKFVVPFLLLLPRGAKRNPGHLVRVSCLMLVMQFVDIYWLVYPNFHETPVFPIWEVGIFLGFLGFFLLTVTKFLGANNLVPMKDPRLHESLNHHI